MAAEDTAVATRLVYYPADAVLDQNGDVLVDQNGDFPVNSPPPAPTSTPCEIQYYA